MFFRRFGILLLALAILLPLPVQAENGDSRARAEDALQKLVFICECEMDFLSEMDWTYTTFQKNYVTASSIYDAWYTMYFVVGSTEDQWTHGSPLPHFIGYFERYGADFRASMDANDKGKTLISDVQSSLFRPVLKLLGNDIQTAVLYIASLMYHYLHLPEYLSAAAGEIETLKAECPDSPYLPGLESLYGLTAEAVAFAETDAGYKSLDAKLRALSALLPRWRDSVSALREQFTALGLTWEASADLKYEYEISDVIQGFIDGGTVPKKKKQ